MSKTKTRRTTKSSRPTRTRPTRKAKITRTRWTKDDLQTLRSTYRNTPNASIATKLGRKPTAINAMAQRLGLSKSSAHRTTVAQQNIAVRWAR